MGNGVAFPGCEANRSLSSNAEVKNVWSYTSTPSNTCIMCYLFSATIQDNRYRASLQGVMRLGRGADHIPTSRAEVKERLSYISTSPLGLHGLFYGEL
jgi:hypothetical protein